MKTHPAIWVLGTMSGTSLDGVDAALIRTDGEQVFEFGETAFRSYSASEQGTLRAALGQWSDGPDVEAAQEVVETAHAALLSQMLAQTEHDAALIGFHGQTLAHDPYGLQGAPRTHQTGDGALLAHLLQRPVCWDFRSADVQLGGQGAPLAPFFHFACARWLEATQPIAFLNLGGVGNITYVDPRKGAPEADGALLAFDTGPANAPMNDLMMARRGEEFDADGALAATGDPETAIVEDFLRHPYFHKMPPKSLDRDDFERLPEAVEPLSDADAMATLSACVVAALDSAMQHLPARPERLLVTGGGRKNSHLMKSLQAVLQAKVEDLDETGLNGDMLEAQAFAYLAARVQRGLPTSAPGTTGVAACVGGGVISRP